MSTQKRLNTNDIRKMKQNKQPIAMITAYDYPSARLADEAEADMILVGDSLGMVVLGYDSTVPVTMDDMLHHTKASVRGSQRSFIVTDLPFAAYHGSIDTTIKNAALLLQQGGAQAIKMEGGSELVETVQRCVFAGIPIVGHIGLTPQAVNQFGGYRVQGRDLEDARRLLHDALKLEAAGAFAIVLEMVPEPLAAYISEQLTIPTIGIGAGRYCDGQVLVYHDLLQYASPLTPRFVKTYADLATAARTGIQQYVQEVKAKQFPEEEHAFQMEREVMEQLMEEGKQRGASNQADR